MPLAALDVGASGARISIPPSTGWEDPIRSVKFAAVALVLVWAAVGTLAACGDDDEDATTTVEQTTTKSGAAEGEPTTTGAVETTPGGAVVPATPNCAEGQIYSQGTGACVKERQGSNPCPPGEVPAADQPACLPKD